MKEQCSKCGIDYVEVFEDGTTYCFGCGNRSTGSPLSIPSSHNKRPLNIIPLLTLDQDYQRLQEVYHISRRTAITHGFRLVSLNGHVRLSLPVILDGKCLYTEYKLWKGSGVKVLGSHAPKDGLAWFSWEGNDPGPLVVVCEGILDAARVSQMVPACAILGTHVSETKARLLTLRVGCARLIIMLDADATDKAIAVSRMFMGREQRTIVNIPSKDPKYMTDHELNALLSEFRYA